MPRTQGATQNGQLRIYDPLPHIHQQGTGFGHHTDTQRIPTQEQVRGHQDFGRTTEHDANVHRFVGDRDRGYRDGYENRGTSFHFNFWLGSPSEACVPSPWYVYTTMPAYIPMNQVVVQPVAVDWNDGYTYDYGYGDNDALNNSISEITAIFAGGQTYQAGFLADGREQVRIFSDGQYEYTINGADFQQMIQDNVANTQTISFQVTGVRINGNYAIVDCAHTFQDPDGGTQTVNQEYRLWFENGRYILTDFSTN